jgi:hypothetical protein
MKKGALLSNGGLLSYSTHLSFGLELQESKNLVLALDIPLLHTSNKLKPSEIRYLVTLRTLHCGLPPWRQLNIRKIINVARASRPKKETT